MGREFASAAARWSHLNADIARPEIVAVADLNPANAEWFKKNYSTVQYVFSDYQKMLELKELEAVYAAVPHVLHGKVYTDILRAGKHLMGEKPFGMDKAQNDAIMLELSKHPALVVRCASEFPYFPAMQMIIQWIREKRFGRILEIHCGFNHSSDMDLTKPINWKRQASQNGVYGCMGDLGIHTQHVPFRMGFKPEKVFAKLSKFVTQRPDGKGGTAACDTWENATLICDALDHGGNLFPMYMETKRMAPGCTNNWFFEIYGQECSAKFTSSNPNILSYAVAWGKEQAWASIDVGYKPMIPTITGPIFEFGFCDAILQMWAAYMSELEGLEVSFPCFLPEETALSHRVYTAALKSHETGESVVL
jgi:predicted dehydrogenase